MTLKGLEFERKFFPTTKRPREGSAEGTLGGASLLTQGRQVLTDLPSAQAC
jgi:hypothetical protein